MAAIILWLFFSLTGNIQAQNHAVPIIITDTTSGKTVKTICTQINCNDQLDLIDVGSNIIHKGKGKRIDTGEIKSEKLRISVVPAAGYTLQTGFAGIVAGNAAFYTDTSANASAILTSFTYTVRSQIIVPFQASIYTKENKYAIVVDWRYLYFPSYTYGLGGYTSLSDGYLIDYSCIRLHQTVLRKVTESMYLGLGYNMDYFFDIEELDPPGNKVTDFERYGFNRTEFASGFTFNYLYDTRTNPINPERGSFVNITYRPNLTIFGNTATWRSLVVDLRKYFKFSQNSDNVLAFWSYEWFTVSGKPPYLMMPNTGGDPYSNTGRGYIQGRYRGNNMAYLEGEYRFAISHNGLLGGVVFANAESFTEQVSNKFETIEPGWGAGIRLKFNKFSRTNVALDYGFGIGGSGGVFVNVGEVF
ncbi:MAG: BamA/TamA family outer membrane protein [Chitinophagales bacterium]